MNSPTYTGSITQRQLQWLYNDLSHVPQDRLVVLNLHIPLVTVIDQEATKHQVANVRDAYALLEGRPALAFSGHTHTHTLEQIRPGELVAAVSPRSWLLWPQKSKRGGRDSRGDESADRRTHDSKAGGHLLGATFCESL